MTFDHADALAQIQAGHADRNDGSLALSPTTLNEAAELLAELQGRTVPVSFVGSGSSRRRLGMGSVGATMDSSRIVGVVDYQPDDLTLVVRSGTTLTEIDHVLADRGLTAVLPESSGDRTVGGVVSSGTSGYRRLRYGPIRDRVLGVSMATGYGEVVKGGGRLVKNVTGYDLPRLATGAYGSLGFIGDVCLKLWPQPPIRRTLQVEDITQAQAVLYQPVALLETAEGSFVFVEGQAADVAASRGLLGAESVDGHVWPSTSSAPYEVSLRVPPANVRDAIGVASAFGADSFVAQHGVGMIDASFSSSDSAALTSMRQDVGALGGVAVVTRWPSNQSLPDIWGSSMGQAALQGRLRDLFDPGRVIVATQLGGGA